MEDQLPKGELCDTSLPGRIDRSTGPMAREVIVCGVFNDLATLNTVQVRSHFKRGGNSFRGVQNTMARMASRHIRKYSGEAQSTGLGRPAPALLLCRLLTVSFSKFITLSESRVLHL